MIRFATPADLADLLAVEGRIFGADAWTGSMLAQRVQQTLLETDEHGSIRGWLVFTVSGDFADLERIAVIEQARRGGVAARLLAAGLAHLRGLAPVPVHRLLLEVRADNTDAWAFYATHGFTEIDRRRRYYADGTDAVVLELGLSGAEGDLGDQGR